MIEIWILEQCVLKIGIGWFDLFATDMKVEELRDCATGGFSNDRKEKGLFLVAIAII